MNNKLKCVIIGYGYMGQIRHKAISKNNKTKLIGIFDKDIKKIQKLIDKNLIIKKYSDIFNIDFDIAFICTPNNITSKVVIECLSYGKHVFCEKPPGKNISDLKKIKKHIGRNKIMFGFNHRFHPAVVKAKNIIDSNKFGKIITIRGVYGKSGGLNFKNSWRNNKKISGGGILLDQGIHMIDLFRFFCGNFDKIKCYTSNSFWKFNVEDNAFLILKNNKKQLAQLHSSSTLWRHTFRMDIALEKGYILIEGLLSKTGSYGQEKITFASRQFENISNAIGNPSEKVIYFDKDNSWNFEVSKFVDFIMNNNKVSINNYNDAYEAMKIVNKAYKSNK